MTDAAFPPPGACDSHTHVIGDKAIYPLARERFYTPMAAPVAALKAMLARLRLDRVVIVQPSFYGTDNSCTLDALDRLGARARAVAVLDARTPPSELDALHRRGVRGLRVNVASGPSGSLDEVRERLRGASRLCARNGWHLQIFAAADAIEALMPLLDDLPVAVVIDHFGLLAPGSENSRAAAALMRLLQSGRAFVKLSAAYRITTPPWHDMAPLARALAAANPDRVVWGTDWPHTPGHGRDRTSQGRDTEQPFQDIDTPALLDTVRVWFDDATLRQKLLVDNPARLYDF